MAISNNLTHYKPNGDKHQGLLRVLVAENSLKTFCKDRFTIIDAHVACTSKGYAGALKIVDGTIFENYNVTTGVVDLKCSGVELSLRDCPQFNLHLMDNCVTTVGVICNGKY